MRELTQDPFYELIGKEYDRCVIDYCLVESEFPYRGMQSHRETLQISAPQKKSLQKRLQTTPPPGALISKKPKRTRSTPGSSCSRRQSCARSREGQ